MWLAAWLSCSWVTRFGQVEHLLADFATQQDNHHQHLAAAGGNQFQVFDAGCFRQRGGDQRGAAALVGKHRGSQSQPLVGILAGLVELVDDHAPGIGRQLSLLDQALDEETVAFFGGHPAG